MMDKTTLLAAAYMLIENGLYLVAVVEHDDETDAEGKERLYRSCIDGARSANGIMDELKRIVGDEKATYKMLADMNSELAFSVFTIKMHNDINGGVENAVQSE